MVFDDIIKLGLRKLKVYYIKTWNHFLIFQRNLPGNIVDSESLIIVYESFDSMGVFLGIFQ